MYIAMEVKFFGGVLEKVIVKQGHRHSVEDKGHNFPTITVVGVNESLESLKRDFVGFTYIDHEVEINGYAYRWIDYQRYGR